MILWAMTALMARRLAQPAHLSNAHLACLLTCLFLADRLCCALFAVLAHVVASCRAAVLGAGWPSRAGPPPAGLRRCARPTATPAWGPGRRAGDRPAGGSGCLQ